MLAFNTVALVFACVIAYSGYKNQCAKAKAATKKLVDINNNRISAPELTTVLKTSQNYTLNWLFKNFNLMKFKLIALNFILGSVFGLNLVHFQANLTPISSNNADSSYQYKAWFDLKIKDFTQVEHKNGYVKVSFRALLLGQLAKNEGDNNQSNNLNKHLNKSNKQGSLNSKSIRSALKRQGIHVFWYLNPKEFKQLEKLPKLGETWRLLGKLKPSHSSLNPGTKDYETWLYQKGIGAKLIVSGLKTKSTHQPVSIQLEPTSILSTAYIRLKAKQLANQSFANSNFNAIYQALIMGDKSQIEQSQWQLFRQTGTVHLMAISGLHMSIMAAIGFLLAKALWWGWFYKQRLLDFSLFAALISVFFATGYLVVSGGDIPTQRAWIMVLTFIVFLLLQRKFQPFSALAMAALAVVVWDVSAVLSSGFWLSFVAVWLIFLSLPLCKGRSKLSGFLVIQVVLSVGLTPLIVWHYAEVPVYGILANLVAVPFITFIGLPLLLISYFLSLISLDVAHILVGLLDEFWQWLWAFLIGLQSLPLATIKLTGFNFYWLLSSYVVLFFIVKWFSAQRVLVKAFNPFKLTLLLSLLSMSLLLHMGLAHWFNNQVKMHNLSKGEALVSVLDVGQGLAVVIQTQNHTLLYDSGPKWGEYTSAADKVILPFLQHQKITMLDKLIVSHSDNDHAGGVLTVLQNINSTDLHGGQPIQLNQIIERSQNLKPQRFNQCFKGQTWQYDKVKFEVLWPPKPQVYNANLTKAGLKLSDNDWSCVLKVTSGVSQFIVTGDLGNKYEQVLVNSGALTNSLSKQTLYIAGHHGSKYSSSNALLQALQPDKVVFSSGFANRFGFPSKEVIARLQKQVPKARWWNTACSGGLSFLMSANNLKLVNESRKSQRKWYHHRCSLPQQGVLFQ